MPELLTVAEMAERLGEDYSKVRYAVSKGIIKPAHEHGRTRLFSRHDLDTLRNYFQEKKAYENADCSITMPFGKFLNKPLNKVPRGYLDWALKNCDMTDEFRSQVEAVIRREIPTPSAETPTFEDQLAKAMGRSK